MKPIKPIKYIKNFKSLKQLKKNDVFNASNNKWSKHILEMTTRDLNQYINKFGGKSRKSNRTRKSKRRRNRKSKKRR